MLSRKVYGFIILLLFSILSILYLYQDHEYDTSTPQATWQSLLMAMKHGDLQAVQSLTTDRGFVRLQNNQSRAENIENWSKMAEVWLDSEILYESIDQDSAILHFGSRLNPLMIDFVKDSEGWKIDYLAVGE